MHCVFYFVFCPIVKLLFGAPNGDMKRYSCRIIVWDGEFLFPLDLSPCFLVFSIFRLFF